MTQNHHNSSNQSLGSHNELLSAEGMMQHLNGKTSQNELVMNDKKLLNKQLNDRSIRSGKGAVLTFFDHWTKAGMAFKTNSNTHAVESAKPASLFRVDSSLINVASSLTVSKTVKLEARRQAIKEITIDLDPEIAWQIDSAKARVANSLRPYFLEKEKQEKKDLLIKIESSQMKFESERERMELLEQTKDNLREIASAMRQSRPQYTKALKSLAGFADMIMATSSKIKDSEIQDAVFEDCICFLEEMMDPVETS